MQVTTNVSVDFPKLKWGVNAGETRELPEDKDAQKEILANPLIREVKKGEAPRASASE